MDERYDLDFATEDSADYWQSTEPTVHPVETTPPDLTAHEVHQIRAEIDGLRTTSTMYLDLRPLLLRMWSMIENMHTRIEELENKPRT